MAKKKYCAIVPAYNEAQNIASVIADLHHHQPEFDVIVVNDCSRDDTADVVHREDAILLDLPINLGIGGAVQTGLKYACDNGYALAIQFDGDGQHLAAEVHKIIEPVLAGDADVCIGSRFIGESDYHSPLARRLGIRLLQTINSMLIGSTVTDNTSGFRAFNRRAISFLSSYYPQDYPEPQAVIELHRNRFRIIEVPVRMTERQYGRSSISAHRSLYYMAKVILANLIAISRKPVKSEGADHA